MDRNDYLLVLTILNRIQSDPNVKRFRSVSLKPEMVKRVQSVLEQAGFEVSDNQEGLAFPESQLDRLHSTISVIQAKADSLIDPETITFAQVAEILKRDGALPGIKSDMDDSVLDVERLTLIESSRPPKPWETNS
jgi:hypothetical protein